VLKAIDREETDRVPLDLGSCPSTGINIHAYEKLRKHLGMDSETDVLSTRSQIVRVDEAVLRLFDIDTRMLAPRPSKNEPEATGDGGEDEESYRDEWGVVRTKPIGGHYYVSRPAFEGTHLTIRDLEKHQWPDPTDPKEVEGLAEEGRRLREETDCAIVLSLPGRLISFGQFLRGFEPWMEDLVLNQEFACALLDIGLEIQMELCRRKLEAAGDSVDIVFFADDYGMQAGPIISPDL